MLAVRLLSSLSVGLLAAALVRSCRGRAARSPVGSSGVRPFLGRAIRFLTVTRLQETEPSGMAHRIEAYQAEARTLKSMPYASFKKSSVTPSRSRCAADAWAFARPG